MNLTPFLQDEAKANQLAAVLKRKKINRKRAAKYFKGVIEKEIIEERFKYYDNCLDVRPTILLDLRSLIEKSAQQGIELCPKSLAILDPIINFESEWVH